MTWRAHVECRYTYINPFFLVDCDVQLFYRTFFHFYAHPRRSLGTELRHAIVHPTFTLKPSNIKFHIFSIFFVYVNHNLGYRHADYRVGFWVLLVPYTTKRPHRKHITIVLRMSAYLKRKIYSLRIFD